VLAALTLLNGVPFWVTCDHHLLKVLPIGELKGLYIWSSLAFGPVLSLAGLWAALVLTRGHSYAIRLVRNLFGGAVFVALFLCVASYEPIKTSGWPVIAYELRLPRGGSGSLRH
jgi:hypothetical protein